MKGLDYYSRFVDTLLEAGIRPWCTMYLGIFYKHSKIVGVGQTEI
jgi:hypothetical protein